MLLLQALADFYAGQFVRISEAHSLTYKDAIKYYYKTYTSLIEHPLGVKIILIEQSVVLLIEDSDNG